MGRMARNMGRIARNMGRMIIVVVAIVARDGGYMGVRLSCHSLTTGSAETVLQIDFRILSWGVDGKKGCDSLC
jgi:hypothetical protein